MTDRPGHLTRRQTIGALGLAGAGLAFGRGLPAALAGTPDAAAAVACSLTPAQEEGPFYVALERIRSNIVGTRTGVPLDLRITIVDSTTCKPIKGAAVDIWHADATGRYSDEASNGTTGQTWLRGVQLTDGAGLARFRTIYPGFYAGRVTHIHVKVHVGGTSSGSTYGGGHVAHTGQLFFPDALGTEIYRLSPYTQDRNQRTLRSVDRVYRTEHGASAVLTVTRAGGSLRSGGVRGSITLGVDTKASG